MCRNCKPFSSQDAKSHAPLKEFARNVGPILVIFLEQRNICWKCKPSYPQDSKVNSPPKAFAPNTSME